MKKKAIIGIIIVVILVALAIVCNIDFKKDKEENKITDAIKFKEEYEAYNGKVNENNQKNYMEIKISKNNAVKYSTIDEVIDIINNGTGVIYLGYPTCPWCRNMVPVLLSAANSTSLANIYYVNMYEVRDKYELDENNKPKLVEEGDKKYQDLLDALDSILDNYTLETEDGKEVKVGEKRVYVPLVVFVKDGKIVGHHADTVKSQTDPYKALDDDQTEELYNIYIENIDKVQKTQCDDNC